MGTIYFSLPLSAVLVIGFFILLYRVVCRDLSDYSEDQVKHFFKKREEFNTMEREIQLDIRMLNEKQEEIEQLYELIKELNGTVNLKDMIDKLQGYINKVVLGEAELILFDGDNQEAVNLKQGGTESASGRGLEKGVLDWLQRSGKTYFKVQEEWDTRYDECRDIEGSVMSMIVSPIHDDGKLVAALKLVNYGIKDEMGTLVNVYAKDDIRTVELLGEFVGIALNRIGLYKRLEELSIVDTLTGVYNRKFISEFLEKECSLARRGNALFSVLLFDIDHFKKFNDTYGHSVGDYVLKEVAQILKAGVRNIDTVGRYGGEEFIAILPETDHQGGIITGERLRESVEAKRFIVEGIELGVTISGGLGMFPHDGTDPTKILAAADKRLYESKSAGRNRVTGPSQVGSKTVKENRDSNG